jgi:hypothetical protein
VPAGKMHAMCGVWFSVVSKRVHTYSEQQI